MAVSSEYLDYVHDQLSGLGGVTSRRMFGGAGLYCDEFFFALIDNDTLYLRVNDANRADFTTRGMSQFRPYPDSPQLSMSYYETPADVLEDAAALVAWARRSVAAAMAAVKPAAKAAKAAKGAKTAKRQRAARCTTRCRKRRR
ncbi:MAG: TfoX/Sxy family protein [Gammaproteobacteria bacterium]|nr:MAG: TfoX/Sxy family protein [Gammaproteobacteria bacterium]